MNIVNIQKLYKSNVWLYEKVLYQLQITIKYVKKNLACLLLLHYLHLFLYVICLLKT